MQPIIKYTYTNEGKDVTVYLPARVLQVSDVEFKKRHVFNIDTGNSLGFLKDDEDVIMNKFNEGDVVFDIRYGWGTVYSRSEGTL